MENKENFEVKKSEDEWEKELGEDAFCIIRQKGTERPFTGKYVNNHDKGIYYCAACGLELFKSDTKYDSGSGWPSFFQPVDDKAITEDVDNTHGMRRVEIMCSKCGGHLGHVFEDGPKPSGLRYCVNSASLRFEKKD